MAKVESIFAGSFNSMDSRKRKGVPLPYLIRPRREFTFDTYGLYNDYLEFSPIIDEDDSSLLETVETKSCCFGGNCFGLKNESNASLSETGGSVKYESDEEYVIINSVKLERVGAIQMFELSKDVLTSPTTSEEISKNNTCDDESESEGEGSNNDEAESEGEGSNSDGWEFV